MPRSRPSRWTVVGPKAVPCAGLQHVSLQQLLKKIQGKGLFPVPRFITYGAPLFRSLLLNISARLPGLRCRLMAPKWGDYGGNGQATATGSEQILSEI
jgi:hypothetical protein